MKIIDSFWFTNPTTVEPGLFTGIVTNPPYGTVGIVVGEDEATGKRKAYVGTAQGFDQKADEQRVLEWGTKFKVERINQLLTILKKER